ncbi:oxygenase MpaB family protein [Gordonia sp. LSe1-13]|uniref:Oxygenase MpaB family protein n=1 Tax=Gordonia sesuvii TaxID=3116777 RepID=A0ABU7MEW6_9ACTN|nr:oxygenase MpaB family protein [Gordonia sp. LSe1-13]
MGKQNRNTGLNPETQFMEIYRNLSTYEFPWDINQALSFALFRTYAVPSIGALLDETGAFTDHTQKRYDDTAILLEVPLIEGFDSSAGKAAIRRINQMHKMYDISDDDFRYVLSTFVVVPVRWLARFGWRELTDTEQQAMVRYYQALGRHMAIKDIPDTYEQFAALMDAYEAEHFAYDAGARRVADSTMELMASFYPSFAARGVDIFSRSLMDEPLITAFRYREPGTVARAVSVGALKARARMLRFFPARRRPALVQNMSRVRSYPDGYDIEKMGTFAAPGCPVHRSDPASGAAASES